MSKGYQAATEESTAGRAAEDSRGLPRYKDGQGGSSSTGQGGSEGAAAGPNKGINPGNLLEANGDGSYRFSRAFMGAVGNEFRETFGFNPSTARVKFGWAYGSPAFTYENTITIDPSKGWAGWDSVAQGDLLVHELTHSVQYAQGGAATVMARTLGEGAQVWRDVYERSPDLIRITNLKNLNVLDSRFTIESIATHVEKTMAPSSNAAYKVR